MSELENLHTISFELANHLEGGLPKEEREAFIEKIAQFLIIREGIIRKLDASMLMTNDNKRKEIIELTKKIDLQLSRFKELIQTDLNNVRVKKETSRKYEGMYEDGIIDGIYFDKKS